MKKQIRNINVILPLALDPLTYAVPQDLFENIQVGVRVIVPLRGKKLYSGVVLEVLAEKEVVSYSPSKVIDVIDSSPVVTTGQLALWRWLSNYYLCTLGEVLITAMPSLFKMSSETKFKVDLEEGDSLADLSPFNRKIVNRFEDEVFTIQDAIDVFDKKTIYKDLQDLVALGFLKSEEDIQNKFFDKKEAYVFFDEKLKVDALEQCMQDLEKRAPKQLECLLRLYQLSNGNMANFSIKKSQLKNDFPVSDASIKALVDKEILSIKYLKESRIQNYTQKERSIRKLSSDQENSLVQIKEGFKQEKPVLLFGVTASGKTELYIHLIKEEIAKQRQVLFLVPEIALTTQITQRIQEVFGDQVGVYHSRNSTLQQTEMWYKQLSNAPYNIIVGPRSALFLPFKNVGLVILDEEHEASYKQASPAPRYNARDVGIVLAKAFKANVLLGSATPSTDSIYNCSIGKYHLVELKTRYSGVALPKMEIVNLKRAHQKKLMKSHFSQILLDKMEDVLRRGQKTILFQNRRGFALYLQCLVCDHIQECPNCDVSLTYHKFNNQLKCHYCGYTTENKSVCQACESNQLSIRGFGTEKLEEELEIFFPGARVERMDLDTTRRKNAFERIMNRFEQNEIDILVGTQMITKGLDFSGVGLVGVMNADNLLHFPSFKTNERAAQLLIQVAGRASRRGGETAEVLIQTYTPGHHVLEKVLLGDYMGLVEIELNDRSKFYYPPYYRLIYIKLLHKDPKILEHAANHLASVLRQHLPSGVLGPEFEIIPRVRNYYHMRIVVKLGKSKSYGKYKEMVRSCILNFNISYKKNVKIQVDVDPVS